MIASITGVLVRKSPQHLIVEVHGIGYQIYTSLQSFYRLPEVKEQVTLHTHTHHTGDTLQLYGFLTPVEREVFLHLVGVSSIGPRSALAVLSGMSVSDLVGAVQGGDIQRLKSVPGIGVKTAGRLVLELKDKLAHLAPQAPKEVESAWPQAQPQIAEDALSALVNLGYSRQSAKEAVKKIFRDHASADEQGSLSVEELIRSSLKVLSNL